MIFLKPRFCPKCGITEDKSVFYKGFCEKCFLEREHLIQPPLVVNIPYCNDCEKVHFKGHLVFGTDKIIVTMLSKHIDTKHFDKPKFSIEIEDDLHNRFLKRAKVTVVGLVDGKKLSIEQDFVVKFEKKQCETCRKISAGYFQSRIELRWDVKDEDIKITLKILKKNAITLKKEGIENVFISRVAEVKDGVDILIGSYLLVERSIKEIAKKLDSRCRASKKLLGIDRETSRRRYRSYYKFVIKPPEEEPDTTLEEGEEFIDDDNEEPITESDENINEESEKDLT